jgi:molybdopterin/thiamine biosynthesis adenylyltransferase
MIVIEGFNGMDFFETQELVSGLTPEFDRQITDKSLLIIGIGGNGTHLAVAAARMGFREIVGVDCDVVSPGNLTRQVLYSKTSVGQRKAAAAEAALEFHNLRSAIRIHDFNILETRKRFIDLAAAADIIFSVVDQPSTTFFIVDACYKLKKPAIVGGTCVLSGTTTRISWMDGQSTPCLNCATRIPEKATDWARYYSHDGHERTSKPEGVVKLDETLSLEGGHPSIYLTACIGSNYMLCVALNIFMGRKIPHQLEASVIDLTLKTSEIKANPNCFTCGR